jgi:hypothetical protein
VNESEHLYFAVRRGGKWITKRVEDASAQDVQGIQFERDFMSARTTRDEHDAAIVQVETNVRAGEDPFTALRSATQTSPGLELLRKLVREAGFRVTTV